MAYNNEWQGGVRVGGVPEYMSPPADTGDAIVTCVLSLYSRCRFKKQTAHGRS